MNFFENYYKNIIKYDLINKFLYYKLKKIPKIQKIILDFGGKTSSIKQLFTTVLALEFIGCKKAKFLVAKKGNLFLKIKKGDPIGCQVVLRKKIMYNFFTKFFIEIIHRMGPNFKVYKKKKKLDHIVFYKIKNKSFPNELLTNYNLFSNDLTDLNITIISYKTNQKEIFYLINSFKIPLPL